MSERMFIVKVFASDDVAGVGEVTRLAKHVDGRVALVEEDNGLTLLVRVVLPDGDPSATTETWDVASEVAEPFTTPDQQPTATIGLAQHVSTKANVRNIKRQGQKFTANGAQRFRRNPVDGTIAENIDARPTLRFAPTLIEVDSGGGPPITFQAERLVGGVVDTTFNDNIFVQISDNKRVRMNFTAGVATGTIIRAQAKSFTIEANVAFLVEEPLVVRIDDLDF